MNNYSRKWDKRELERSVRESNPYTYDASERVRRILIHLSFLGVSGVFLYLLLVL